MEKKWVYLCDGLWTVCSINENKLENCYHMNSKEDAEKLCKLLNDNNAEIERLNTELSNALLIRKPDVSETCIEDVKCIGRGNGDGCGYNGGASGGTCPSCGGMLLSKQARELASKIADKWMAEKEMDLQSAIKVIEDVAGFNDSSTGVGEAWSVVMRCLRLAFLFRAEKI